MLFRGATFTISKDGANDAITLNSSIAANAQIQVLSGDHIVNPDIEMATGDPIITIAGSSSLTLNGVLSDAVTGQPAAVTLVGPGTLNLTNANTYTGDTRIESGTLAIAANSLQYSTLNMVAGDTGVLSVSGAFTLGGLKGDGDLSGGTATVTIGKNNQSTTYSGVLSNASVTKIGTGTLTLTGANTYTGLTTVNGGTLELGAAARTNVLDTANGGVNVMAGKIVFDYSGASDDPAATVLANLKTSYSSTSGRWADGPMFSTTAALSTNVGLGWVDNGTSVTVKPAVYGDADLNGAVGSSDLSIVLSNFGKAGVWATGDFDYNGTVGSSDLSIVLANFGQTLPASYNVASYTNLDAAAIDMLNAAGIKTVPEPGTLALSGCRPVGFARLRLAEANVVN